MVTLFARRLMLVRIRDVTLHSARRFVRGIYLFEYDLFRKQPMAEITAVERHVFPLPELDALVEHEQFQIRMLEKPAGRHVVQPIVGHQQGERFPEFQAAVEDFHLPAERRIGHEHVPLGRLIVEKILPVADMGMHDMETGIPEFQHKFAVLRVERAPDCLSFGYVLDDRQYAIPRRIFLIRRVPV